MCNIFCCFGCLTLCGCRDRVTRRLVFFPPPCTYAVDEAKDPNDGTPRHTMYLLTERGERVEGYSSPNFHYALLPTKRRQRIATLFIAQPSSSTTLLFSHGNATDLGCMRPHLVDLAEQLQVNVCAYDYTGYGLSSGQPSASNCNADIAAVHRYLRTVHPAACHRIILYGQSLGSGPTLYLASHECVSGVIIHSGLMSCVRVLDSTVSSTPFYDIFPNVSHSSSYLQTIARLSRCILHTAAASLDVELTFAMLCLVLLLQIDLVSRAKGSPPFFILHGEKDAEIPALHAQQLYGRASQPYSLWLVNEAGHNDVEVRERAEYWRRLDEFVRFVEAKVDTIDVVEQRVKEEKSAGKAKVR